MLTVGQLHATCFLFPPAIMLATSVVPVLNHAHTDNTLSGKRQHTVWALHAKTYTILCLGNFWLSCLCFLAFQPVELTAQYDNQCATGANDQQREESLLKVCCCQWPPIVRLPLICASADSNRTVHFLVALVGYNPLISCNRGYQATQADSIQSACILLAKCVALHFLKA
jgi:hypothetical protein